MSEAKVLVLSWWALSTRVSLTVILTDVGEDGVTCSCCEMLPLLGLLTGAEGSEDTGTGNVPGANDIATDKEMGVP